MKRIITILLAMLILVSAITPVMANDNITVKIDGKKIAFDVQPQLINNRTMVPLRAIFEALGATVDWNDATQTVTSTKGATTISLTINNPTMYVNGTSVALDSPACLVGARTLVPVRAISEAFGTKVEWDDSTSTVNITNVIDVSMNTNLSTSTKVSELKNDIIKMGQKTSGGYGFKSRVGTMELSLMHLVDENVCTFNSNIYSGGVNVAVTLILSETQIPAVILKYDGETALVCNYPQPNGGINVAECMYSKDVENLFLEMIDLSYDSFESLMKPLSLNYTLADFGVKKSTEY